MVMMTEEDIRSLKSSAEVMQKNGFPSMKNEILLLDLILGEGK
jgi:hypothetical protein